MEVPPWPCERIKARRALKEAVFSLIYGAFVPSEKREAAESAIRDFDAESKRLYPEIAAEREKAQAHNRWLDTVDEVLITQYHFGGAWPISGDHRPR